MTFLMSKPPLLFRTNRSQSARARWLNKSAAKWLQISFFHCIVQSVMRAAYAFTNAKVLHKPIKRQDQKETGKTEMALSL